VPAVLDWPQRAPRSVVPITTHSLPGCMAQMTQ
jgi:hypothetical protein